MKKLIIILPALLLGACIVSETEPQQPQKYAIVAVDAEHIYKLNTENGDVWRFVTGEDGTTSMRHVRSY